MQRTRLYKSKTTGRDRMQIQLRDGGHHQLLYPPWPLFSFGRPCLHNALTSLSTWRILLAG